MVKHRAAFVVGHAHWGKSLTLRALTGGLHRYLTINEVMFFIRRMSNDDRPDELVELVDAVDPANRNNLLIALCPNFTDEDAQTEHILETLQRKGYRLFFFVLEHQYNSAGLVQVDEIARLRTYGTVEVYSGTAESEERARRLRSFLSDVVVA